MFATTFSTFVTLRTVTRLACEVHENKSRVTNRGLFLEMQ